MRTNDGGGGGSMGTLAQVITVSGKVFGQPPLKKIKAFLLEVREIIGNRACLSFSKKNLGTLQNTYLILEHGANHPLSS